MISFEYLGIKQSGRCPKCNSEIYYRNYDNVIPRIVYYFTNLPMRLFVGSKQDKVLYYHECKKCGKRWQVYSDQKDYEGTKYEVINIQTVYEKLTEEERIIDNLESTAEVTRTLSFSKTWTRSYKIESLKARESEKKIETLFSKKFNINKSVKDIIQDQYSIELNENKSYAEDITIKVPPYTKVNVKITWKNIWIKGEVRIFDFFYMIDESIPFEFIKEVSFDSTQQNIASK